MRIYHPQAGGPVLAVCEGRDLPTGLLDTPDVASLRFDPETNPDLVTALLDSPGAYSVEGGQLMLDGAPVTIAAPGTVYSDRQAIANLLTKLESGTSLTAAETRQAWRAVLRFLRSQID